MKTLLLALALALALQDTQVVPPTPAPVEQHEWLRQLVGDWTVTSDATLGAGTVPTHVEAEEHVRPIGKLWVVAESTADAGGMPLQSLLTLGYDPAAGVFVGTWIDSVQPHLWSYTGTLDEAKRVLTLESVGPTFNDPTKTGKFRDVIELLGADHRTLTSSVQGEDGTWTTFARADYRRKD